MKENTKSEIYSWLKSIAFAFIFAFICNQFLFAPTTVLGESMSPSFKDHERVIVSKVSKVKRLDVIVFEAPDIEDEHYIKRVIGLPGDSIEMKNDVLYINEKAVNEPYLLENKKKQPLNNITEDFSLQEKAGKSTVPKDMLFVMGDNRLKSKDSRAFGLIPSDSVIGVVKFKYHPLFSPTTLKD